MGVLKRLYFVLFCTSIVMFNACKKAEVAETTEATTQAETEVQTTEAEAEVTTEEETEVQENCKVYYSTEDSNLSVKLLNPLSNTVDYVLYDKEKEIDSGYISLILADDNTLYGYSNNSFFIRPRVVYSANELSFDYSECSESDYADAKELYTFVQEKMPVLMTFKSEEDTTSISENAVPNNIEENIELATDYEEEENTSFNLEKTAQFTLDNSKVFTNEDNYKLYLYYSSSQAINYSLFKNSIEIDNGCISLLWADEGKLYAIPSYSLMSKDNAALVSYNSETLTIDYTTIKDQSYINRNYYLSEYLASKKVSFHTDYDVISDFTGAEYVEGVGYLSPEDAEEYYKAHAETEPETEVETESFRLVGEENLSSTVGILNISSEVLKNSEFIGGNNNWQDNVGYTVNSYKMPSGAGNIASVLYIERNTSYYPNGTKIDEDSFSKLIETVMSSSAMSNYRIDNIIDETVYYQLLNTSAEITTQNNKFYGKKSASMPGINAAQVATMTSEGVTYGVIVVSEDGQATEQETLDFALKIINHLQFSLSN